MSHTSPRSDDLPLSELLPFSSADREQMLRAAVECYGDGEFAKAETILVGLMTLDRKDPRPAKLLASTLLFQDRHREAETMYEWALKLDATDPYTLVALAELKLKALKVAEAMPLFDRLFALDPRSEHPAGNRGRDILQTFCNKLDGQSAPARR